MYSWGFLVHANGVQCSCVFPVVREQFGKRETGHYVMFWQIMGLNVPELFICLFMIHLHHIWSDIVRYGIRDKG